MEERVRLKGGTRFETRESIISGGENGEFRIGVIKLTVNLIRHLSALQESDQNRELASLFQYFCDICRRRRRRGLGWCLARAATEEEKQKKRENSGREDAIHDLL